MQFVLLGEMNPLHKRFIPGGRLSYPPEKIACTKAFSSHRCQVEISGKFACDFSMYCNVSRGFLMRIPSKSERNDRFQPGKIP